MRDLTDFLRARFDEDQAVAQRASDDLGHVLNQVEYSDSAVEADERHIARHDPARVLREVEAKRVLLADYERFVAERRRMMGGWDSGEVSPVLTAFASVYAGHPDYRDEWRP